MLNLLSSSQMKELDAYTIKSLPISSIDLMERAATVFTDKLLKLYPRFSQSFLICCGTGNNGGDGLAVARLLYEAGYDVKVWIAAFSQRQSSDYKMNFARLAELPVDVITLNDVANLPPVEADVIIDALIGTGIKKALSEDFKKLVGVINNSGKTIVSIDIPTGLGADGNFDVNAVSVNADDVITFQVPKISFVFPESLIAVKRFHTVSLGLDENFINSLPATFKFVRADDITNAIKPRTRFSHKGQFGHALIIAGSVQTMGAALISAEACLRTGAGLTTVCIPISGLSALNTRLPEVMALHRNDFLQSALPYAAIAIGPGMGVGKTAEEMLGKVLNEYNGKLVLDADALNLLALHKEHLQLLKEGTILTPHMKEFDRIFGASVNWWERVKKAQKAAIQYKVIIVLKNQYSFISLPDGEVLVNSTGNSSMSNGGMGDALTGIIVSLLAQGYTAERAAMIGCFVHGKAGDMQNKKGMAIVTATALNAAIPEALYQLIEPEVF